MTAHPFREASSGDLILCDAPDCRKHISTVDLVEIEDGGSTRYFCTVGCSSVFIIAREVEAERARMREAAAAAELAEAATSVCNYARNEDALATTTADYDPWPAEFHIFDRRDFLLTIVGTLGLIAVFVWIAMTGGAQ